MNVQAWQIEEQRELEIPTSPVGRITVIAWRGHAPRLPTGGSAVILPVGQMLVSWDGSTSMLAAGCYAQVPNHARVTLGAGVIIATPDYYGLTQIGGPVEPVGRLKYIDGCSDSLLICPARKGEPCLNLLHLPPGVDQTQHTQPSERIGIILRGGGVCRTPDQDIPLLPGMFWHIPAGALHSFHTLSQSLDVFAWHPDSDFGPSHDAHPMLNRTMVGGVSASDESIRDSKESSSSTPGNAWNSPGASSPSRKLTRSAWYL
jgi:quercetin dioxygenase-like cupin family protein